MLPPEPEQAQPELVILAEDFPVWELWNALRTQWRISMSGPTGLDYSVLTPHFFELFGIDQRHRRRAFDLIRRMEIEALNQLADK